MIKAWGYGETWDVGCTERRNVRFVGKMHLIEFMNTILQGDHRGRAWIRPRTGNTSNPFALDIIEKHPNKVVVYDDRTHQILKVLDKY